MPIRLHSILHQGIRVGSVNVKRRTYRVEWERWLNVAISAVSAVALLFMADDGTAGPGSASGVSRLVGYAMVAVACVGLLRSMRIGIVSTGREFVVHGILATRAFRAEDVETFTLEKGRGRLQLRTGISGNLWHVQMPNPRIFPRSQSAQRVIADLNRELLDSRAANEP